MCLQSELPYQEEAFDTLTRRMQTLQELNGGTVIATLADTQQVLDAQFAHAAELSDQLEQRLSDFSTQRDQLVSEISDVTSWLTATRERLVQLDDTSGSDQALLENLNKAKVNTSSFVNVRVRV